MTTIGFIGSGMIGGTVARLSVAAGHNVVMSNSRGPETLRELVAELGPLAAAATAGQAAEAGDLVVVAIPVKAIADVPATPLSGKPVLDAGNYYPQRDGHIEVLDNGALTSSGLLQRHRGTRRRRQDPGRPGRCAPRTEHGWDIHAFNAGRTGPTGLQASAGA